MKIIALPYFYDVLCGVAVLCAFCVVLVLGLLARHTRAKWAIYSALIALFLALPFLNIFLLEGFLRKVEFIDEGSKKLIYIDSFLLQGSIQNRGKVALQTCEFSLYANKRFPLTPDFRVILQNLNLRVGGKVAVTQSIDNLKEAKIKKIALRCY